MSALTPTACRSGPPGGSPPRRYCAAVPRRERDRLPRSASRRRSFLGARRHHGSRAGPDANTPAPGVAQPGTWPRASRRSRNRPEPSAPASPRLSPISPRRSPWFACRRRGRCREAGGPRGKRSRPRRSGKPMPGPGPGKRPTRRRLWPRPKKPRKKPSRRASGSRSGSGATRRPSPSTGRSSRSSPAARSTAKGRGRSNMAPPTACWPVPSLATPRPRQQSSA